MQKKNQLTPALSPAPSVPLKGEGRVKSPPLGGFRGLGTRRGVSSRGERAVSLIIIALFCASLLYSSESAPEIQVQLGHII